VDPESGVTHTTRIRRHFGSLARDYYDRNYVKDARDPRVYPELPIRHQYILDMLEPTGPARRVLDVGCGSGIMVVDLARQGHSVWGIDVAPEMIRKTRLLAAEELIDGQAPELCVGTIESLPFAAEYFDVVIAAGVIEYLEEDAAALRELRRVLRPGGVLIASFRNAVNIARILTHTRALIRKVPLLNHVTDWIVDVIRKVTKRPRSGDPLFRMIKPWDLSRELCANGFRREDFAFYRFAALPEWLEQRWPAQVVPINRQLEIFSRTPLGYLANGYLVKARKV